ncbi:YbaB/EbfC family nucleoid-associated protein [Nocardia sp. NPDC088792]|uniref:YbaB/EbfC family nucleoid-associated protein n=1 Tax=Nocardia sp. NPDC088792 TaxID=3364332 RepID=UPI0037F1AEE6
MANEQLRNDAAVLLDGFTQQLHALAEAQRRRAELTATATACDKRIRVTVNADGLLIHTEFADDIADIRYPDIAAAMTAAVQAAATEVRRRCEELLAPIRTERARLPKLSEIVEGAPDFGFLLPPAPPARMDVRVSAPAAPEPASGSLVSDQDW